MTEEQLYAALDEVLATDTYLMTNHLNGVSLVGDESWTWNLYFLNLRSHGIATSKIFNLENLMEKGYPVYRFHYKTYKASLKDIEKTNGNRPYNSYKKRIKRSNSKRALEYLKYLYLDSRKSLEKMYEEKIYEMLIK